MIDVINEAGHIVPANNDEANGELIGRVNALHDWLKLLALDRVEHNYPSALNTELEMVCTLLGFSDLLRIKVKEETAEPAMSFADMLAPIGNADDLPAADEVLGAEE